MIALTRPGTVALSLVLTVSLCGFAHTSTRDQSDVDEGARLAQVALDQAGEQAMPEVEQGLAQGTLERATSRATLKVDKASGLHAHSSSRIRLKVKLAPHVDLSELRDLEVTVDTTSHVVEAPSRSLHLHADDH